MLAAAPSPPPPDIAQVRERFEAEFGKRRKYVLERDIQGFYKNELTAGAWQGWCAALGVKP